MCSGGGDHRTEVMVGLEKGGMDSFPVCERCGTGGLLTDKPKLSTGPAVALAFRGGPLDGLVLPPSTKHYIAQLKCPNPDCGFVAIYSVARRDKDHPLIPHWWFSVNDFLAKAETMEVPD